MQYYSYLRKKYAQKYTKMQKNCKTWNKYSYPGIQKSVDKIADACIIVKVLYVCNRQLYI